MGGKKKPVNKKKMRAGQPASPASGAARRPSANGQPQRMSGDVRKKQANRQTNKAYDQAVRHRSVKGRRRGSRGRNYIMYYILAAIVVVVVLIVLANTVLFSCGSIEVEGNSRYTAEEIIGKSGLNTGENLLHIDEKAAEQRISAAFTYIDTVEVQKLFPTKIKITVKEAEKWFLISQGSVTAAVSRMGRIVELGSESGLPVIVGYQAADLVPGSTLASSDTGKTEIPAILLEKAEEYGIGGIREIDITDRFDISIECGDNITLQIGGIADIDSKFAAAAGTLEKERSDVTINLRDPEKTFARDKTDGQQQVLPELNSSSEQTAEGTREGTAEV